MIQIHRIISANGVNGRSTPDATSTDNIIREFQFYPLFKANDLVLSDRIMNGKIQDGTTVAFARARVRLVSDIKRTLPFSPTSEIWFAVGENYTKLLGEFDETKAPENEAPVPQPITSGIVKYSDEFSSDGLPRQLSVDFGYAKSYQADTGLPDQYQMYPNAWIPLKKPIQLWLFKCLCLNAYGKYPEAMTVSMLKEAKNEWAQFMKHGRCFTNFASWDRPGLADYVQGINLTKTPMGWEPLVLAGNRLEIVGEEESKVNVYLTFGRKSYVHYPIRVINSEKLPTPEQFLSDSYVCHIPTTIKPNGERGVFPQFGGKCIYPVMAKGTDRAYVWKEFVK